MVLRRSVEIVVLSHVVLVAILGALFAAFLVGNYRAQYDTKLTLETMQHHVRWASLALASFAAIAIVAVWRLVALVRRNRGAAPN
jgi:ABC-type Fe3+ transport system permease subunit